MASLSYVALSSALTKNIEDRLRRIGLYGSLTITKRDGKVVELTTTVTERPLPEVA